MALRFLIEKEFKQISRNRIFVVLILWFPLLTLIVLPWAVNFEVKEVKIAFLDQSHGLYAQRLAQKIKASSSFISTPDLQSYDQGLQRIDARKVDLIIHIPPTFDQDIALNKHPQIFVAASAVDATQAQLATNYIISIVNHFSEEIRREDPHTAQAATPLTIATDYRFNPSLDFKTNMLPAFIVILITLVCGMLPALNIVQEKENGTIQQMNVTPVSKLEFILSKVIPYWIIGLIILTTCVPLVGLVYGLWPRGTIAAVFLVSVIFIISITGFGILVSNYSASLQQAMLLMLFVILIFLLMSGLFSPVDAMPAWGQMVAYANPITHYIEALRLIYLKGSTLPQIAHQLYILLAFAVGINTIAILSYRKTA